MKFLFKVGLVFLIVFNFLVPVIHYSCALAVIIAFFYYMFFKKSLPFTYFYNRYCFTILAATLLIVIIELLYITLHGNLGTGFYERYLVQGWMMLCLVFVLPVLIENEETTYNEALAVICGAFALQGLIHTMSFLMPNSVGSFILRIQGRYITGQELNYFRAYSLTGAPFFDLPSAYGVACIAFFRLQLIPGQNSLRGWKAFIVMFFILAGILLSGRTGFVGLGLGLLLYLVFKWNDLSQMWRNSVKITGGFLCLLVVFYGALTPIQQRKITDNVFPFAFEAYYSWRDTGKFTTGSTESIETVHYYPLETSTILWGDGGIRFEKYTSTDAGYMNHLIIGGVFYLLILILYQWLYFRQPMKMAKSERSKNRNINSFCFFLLFAHMFILEIKGAAIGTIHIIEVLLLYMGVSYLEEQYASEDAIPEDASSEKSLRNSVLV